MTSRDKDIEKTVKKLVSDFQEHNTGMNVRMFVNWTEEGKSAAYSYGGGEWYAQYGQVREWVLIQEERARRQAVKEDESDPSEEAF
jgi:hypothetical protein